MRNPTILAFWALLAYALWLSAISTIPSSIPAAAVDTGLDKSLETMHGEIQKVHISGNVDADFASLMIPHHQGAVQMAEVELQFGLDPRLRDLAEEIIATDQFEIDAMKSAINSSPFSSLYLNRKNWCAR